MKLVPIYASEGPSSSLPPGGVEISPARQQLMGVTTAPAEFRALDKTLRIVGRVAIDETRLVNVHVKASGWIQKVFVNSTWQQVKQGEPLFTLFSPDLLGMEQEFLLALRARDSLAQSSLPEVATGGATLLEAARRRLELWDFTDAQLQQLELDHKPQHDITFYAPATATSWSARLIRINMSLRDGDLQAGGPQRRLGTGDVYESEAAEVRLGQEAVLSTGPYRTPPGAGVSHSSTRTSSRTHEPSPCAWSSRTPA